MWSLTETLSSICCCSATPFCYILHPTVAAPVKQLKRFLVGFFSPQVPLAGASSSHTSRHQRGIRRKPNPQSHLEGGEGVRGDVEGGHLHVVEEVMEVLGLEEDLGQHLVADALPQHDAAVQRHLWRLVAAGGGGAAAAAASDLLAAFTSLCV